MKKNIMLVIGILIAALCCTGLYHMHLERKTGFVVKDHLEDTLIEIGEDKVTLRDSLYYIMLVENQSNEEAEAYEEKVKKSFWNIKTGDEGFVSQVAKKVILEQMIADEILYREAVKNGWEINETEVESATDQVWAEMSQYQKELTGYTQETLKERMAKAYAGQAYGDVYGDTFDEVKESYQVKVNTSIWESIEMGTVTQEK